MTFIRQYKTSDLENIIHIFRETASPDLQAAGDPTLDYASYVWARPHVALVPETCFVVDDGHGTAVGYLLGVPDTTTFVADWEARFLPHLTSLGLTDPSSSDDANTNAAESDHDLALEMRRFMWNPRWLLQSSFPNLMKSYPAHLHIDILPAYQGQRWGQKLMERFWDELRQRHVPGLFVGKAGYNVRAGKFYDRLGFTRFPEVLDDGKSGELGREASGSVVLVKVIQ